MELYFDAQKYKKPFVLEPTKLTRIIEVAKEKFKEQDHEFMATYDVRLKDGTVHKYTSLDDILNTDNLVNNPIQKVKIKGIKLEPSGYDDHQYEKDVFSISFDAKQQSFSNSIELNMSSFEEAEWLKPLQASLAEQIERTVDNGYIFKLLNWVFSFWTIPLTILSLMFFIYLWALAVTTSSEPGKEAVSQNISTLQQTIEEGRNVETIDDKLDYLIDLELENLENNLQEWKDYQAKRSEPLSWPTLSTKTRVVGGLSIIVVLLLFLQRKYFYPLGVFKWGDMNDRHEQLVKWRDYIWSGILFTFVMGLTVNYVTPVLFMN